MRVIPESGLEYRFGDWGPGYLAKGPHWEGGVIVIPPGRALEKHLHTEVSELFYVIEGTPTAQVNQESRRLSPGDSLFVDAGESHTLSNSSHSPVKIFFVKSPYRPADRVTLEPPR